MEFTTSGTISNELVYAGLGTLEECTLAEVGGKIALIKRGEYTFAEKVQNAADAGAVGVIAIWTIGDKPSSVLADLVESYVQKNNIDYIPPGVEDRSDHAAFAENGIPFVYFSYKVHSNNHTDNDTIDKIKVDNIVNVCEIVTEMTYNMAEAPMLQSTQGFHGTVNKYKHNPNRAEE
jgi:Zn-dependent M28 family amino/carboxypeptidase